MRPTWITLAVCAILLSACRQQANEYVPPPPPAVTVARPLQKSITDYLELTGTLEAVESVELRARVTGFLEKKLFTAGQEVDVGDLLYLIDQRPFEVALQDARASLASAVAREERAVTEYARSQRLVKRNAIAETEVVKWKQEVDVSQAEVSAAKAKVENALLDLSYTEIHSPVKGRIGLDLVDVGNLVGAGEYTLLATVRKFDPIYAVFSVNERDLLALMARDRKQGYTPDGLEQEPIPVDLGLANEIGYPHRGRIASGDNTVDPDTGTLTLRGIFDNPEPGVLLPGLFVRVRIPAQQLDDALLVPERALGLDQSGRYLLVVNSGNVVEQRNVEMGARTGGMRVILDGLEPDDRIVIKGIQRAIPGSTVAPEEVELADDSETGSGQAA